MVHNVRVFHLKPLMWSTLWTSLASPLSSFQMKENENALRKWPYFGNLCYQSLFINPFIIPGQNSSFSNHQCSKFQMCLYDYSLSCSCSMIECIINSLSAHIRFLTIQLCQYYVLQKGRLNSRNREAENNKYMH